jgi:DNA replication protein DnaC
MALDAKHVESIQFWRWMKPALYRKFETGAQPGDCPYCQGRYPVNNVRLGDGTVREALWCICQCPALERDAQRSIKMIQHAPRDRRVYRFEDLQTREHKDWAKVEEIIAHLTAVVERPYDAPWITLMGRSGNGKSHLMAAAYAPLRHLAAYVYVDALADDLRQAISNNGVGDLKDAAIDVPVLFLDDLDTEHSNSEFILKALNSIISQRYMAGRARPTIVSTNLNRADLLLRYGRMADRLLDRDLARSYVLAMPSWRTGSSKDNSPASVMEVTAGTDETNL